MSTLRNQITKLEQEIDSLKAMIHAQTGFLEQLLEVLKKIQQQSNNPNIGPISVPNWAPVTIPTPPSYAYGCHVCGVDQFHSCGRTDCPYFSNPPTYITHSRTDSNTKPSEQVKINFRITEVEKNENSVQ